MSDDTRPSHPPSTDPETLRRALKKAFEDLLEQEFPESDLGEDLRVNDNFFTDPDSIPKNEGKEKKNQGEEKGLAAGGSGNLVKTQPANDGSASEKPSQARSAVENNQPPKLPLQSREKEGSSIIASIEAVTKVLVLAVMVFTLVGTIFTAGFFLGSWVVFEEGAPKFRSRSITIDQDCVENPYKSTQSERHYNCIIK